MQVLKFSKTVMMISMLTLSAYGQETVKVRIDKATSLQKASKDLLVPETLLPAGSVIEVPIASYKKPETLPFWNRESAVPNSFVRGVRIISAPGYSARELKDLNEWNQLEGLFMAKKTLADASVVEKDEVASVTVHRPAAIFRNHGRSSTNAPVDNSDTEELIKKIQGSNTAVRGTGRTQTVCPECDSNMVQNWIKSGVVPERPLKLALAQYYKNPGGRVKNRRYFSFVDFTQHSREKRMFVFDMQTGEVKRYHTTHSAKSEVRPGKAGRYSNAQGTNMTPAGFHVTQNGFYYGKHGKSLILHGLEARNSNSARRYIEIHKAHYASDAFVKANGYAGRSHGCLGIDPRKLDELTNRLEGGALVYHYTGE